MAALPRRNRVVEQWENLDLDGNPVPVEDWPMPRALCGESFSGCELRVRRRDTGKEFIGSYNGSLVRNAAGEPLFAMLTVRDITERKRAKESLNPSPSEKQHAGDLQPGVVAGR